MDTFFAATQRLLDGIPRETLVEDQSALVDVFHRFVHDEISYAEFWEELNAYSSNPVPRDIVENEVRYAHNAKNGAFGVAGIMLTYLHRNDLPYDELLNATDELLEEDSG